MIQVAGVPLQTPPLQTSFIVLAFPSLQATELLVKTQPVEVLHESLVQTLPSLQTMAAPEQEPPEHTSPVVQALLSLQTAEVLMKTQPVEVLHESLVQEFPSLQVTADPPPHPLQVVVSPVVQAFPSLQATPKLTLAGAAQLEIEQLPLQVMEPVQVFVLPQLLTGEVTLQELPKFAGTDGQVTFSQEPLQPMVPVQLPQALEPEVQALP